MQKHEMFPVYNSLALLACQDSAGRMLPGIVNSSYKMPKIVTDLPRGCGSVWSIHLAWHSPGAEKKENTGVEWSIWWEHVRKREGGLGTGHIPVTHRSPG